MTMRVNRQISGLFLCVLLALTAAACSDTPTSASSTPGYSQTDVRVGTGTEAAAGSVLAVQYTGWLYDPSKADAKGLQFETSRGNSTAFSFTLGAGQVISGWDQGLSGVKAGGLRRLVLPPSLAYGTSRNGPIPPNATLVFEIEVVSVQ
jgi:FKBP-type peptidyl-prolyl cis-trans isomerase FkpA